MDYRHLLAFARSHTGLGALDAPVDQAEVISTINDWHHSTALTPDLLPRIAFSVHVDAWQHVLRFVQRLVGPQCLALRPRLWRARCMSVTYKRGPPDQGGSYRLLAVLTQHALLQEGILATRIRPLVSPALQPIQGGYIRDSLDTVLYLHELSVHYVACGRCLLAIHGDLIHAFPRTWREELLVLLHYVVGIRDGALAEVASILEWDEWLVPLSGASWKSITQGLPEGGVLGPLLFNLLLDTLSIALRDACCGVARDARVPPIWQEHIWSGAGNPQPSLVQLALDVLHGLRPLPSAAELAYHPDIEASAARALDLFDAHRSAVRFHADDPVFLASSYGAAQEVLRVVADWASVHKAAFHIAQRKTVAMVFGAAATVAAMMAGPKLYFPVAGNGGAFTITWVQWHK